MTQLIAAIVDHSISAAAGITATLLGFGLVGRSWLQTKPAWMRKVLKVCGPLLIITAAVQIFAALLKPR